MIVGVSVGVAQGKVVESGVGIVGRGSVDVGVGGSCKVGET